MIRHAAFAILMFAAGGAPAFAQVAADAPMPAAISLVTDVAIAKFVNDDGLTLYTFDRDTPGVSVCEGQCAVNWPPIAAPADATPIGDWTPATRPDGTLQWAYKGKPVYLFRGDTAPGQTNGDGLGGVWHVVAP